MADNDIGVTDVVGGAQVATDDIGGVHYQLIKLVDGTADSSTPIPGGALGLLVNLTGMKAEDVASVASDLGLPILAVRSDAGGSLVGTDGDYSMLQLDSSGRLRVVTAASYLEDDAAANGDRGIFILVQRHDADTSTVSADGDYSALHVNSSGKLKTADTTGTYLEDDPVASGDRGVFILAQRKDVEGSTVSADGDYSALHVDANGRLRVITAASYLEDDAAVSGDRGMFVLAQRKDADASTVSADGDYSALHVDNKGRLKTVSRINSVRSQVTPTVSTTPAYSAKDAVGGLLTFANAVREAGGSGILHAVQIVDKGQQMAALDLVLFDRTFTAPTDNAIFNPTDAELLTCIGFIPIYSGDYADFSTNSVATKAGIGLEFVLNGTDLFGVLVARGTPTYTSANDIVVALTIIQD